MGLSVEDLSLKRLVQFGPAQVRRGRPAPAPEKHNTATLPPRQVYGIGAGTGLQKVLCPLFCGLCKQRFQGLKRLPDQVMASNQIVRRIKCEIDFTVFRFPSDRFEGQINCQ